MDDTETVIYHQRNGGPTAAKRFLISLYKNSTLIVIFIVGLLINGDVTPLTRRGFFCNDSSINYPHKPDTIGIKTLFFFALILPSIVIKLCDKALKKKLLSSPYPTRRKLDRQQKKVRKISGNEVEVDLEEEELISGSASSYMKRRLRRIDSDDDDSTETNHSLSDTDRNNDKVDKGTVNNDDDDDDEEINLFTRIPLDSDQEKSESERRIKSIVQQDNLHRRPFGEVQLFFFGLCTTMILTGLGKITCGRLRPHFLQRCQPNIDCSLPENAGRYIQDFQCTNKSLRPRDFPYIMTSWPSGHASIMFFSMIYMIIYLNTVIPILVRLSSRKVKRRFDSLALYAIYVLLIGLAGYIAMTRISDYHHHATDVFSGTIIGAFIAIGLTKSLANRYPFGSGIVY